MAVKGNPTGRKDEAEYSSHKQQILECQPSAERIGELEGALLAAYSKVITHHEVPFVTFADMTAQELAEAFVARPIIIKPTLSCINVAQRAIKRDLGFDFDTYSSKISQKDALLLAGYIKPLLPPTIAVPALMELDRFWWTDKEMRARKGNWERTVTELLNQHSAKRFRKRKFTCGAEGFEIDAAHPPNGKVAIEIAIDVKRIESGRDIHKRADEIINKARKFKKTYPQSTFIAIVYFPFPNQHVNLQSRLRDPDVDYIFFAGETISSIKNAIEMLVGKLGIGKDDF